MRVNIINFFEIWGGCGLQPSGGESRADMSRARRNVVGTLKAPPPMFQERPEGFWRSVKLCEEKEGQGKRERDFFQRSERECKSKEEGSDKISRTLCAVLWRGPERRKPGNVRFCHPPIPGTQKKRSFQKSGKGRSKGTRDGGQGPAGKRKTGNN